MFDYNKDAKKRDELIFGAYQPDSYLGGIRRFEGMTLDELKELVELKFSDPEEAQNCSPTIEELIRFAENYEGYEFDGYAVDIERDDYRVSIEAIHKDGPVDNDELKAFIKEFRYADEFDIDDGLYAWWD